MFNVLSQELIPVLPMSSPNRSYGKYILHLLSYNVDLYFAISVFWV